MTRSALVPSVASGEHGLCVGRARLMRCACALLFAAAGASMFHSNEGVLRRLDAPSSVDPKSCLLQPTRKEVTPTFMSSYPGSGSDMTWKLIQGLTGMMVGQGFTHDDCVAEGYAVAVKVHYPTLLHHTFFDKLKNIDRAILLLRNPLHSLPSAHSQAYEVTHNITSHSTRAPLEAWFLWRDENFEKELEKWENHVKYWVENYERTGEERLDIRYESLTSKDPDVGIAESKRIVDFLHKWDEKVPMLPEEQIQCVWETIKGDKGDNVYHTLRKGPMLHYSFTLEQLKEMDRMLERLTKWRPAQLGHIMEAYREEITAEESKEENVGEEVARNRAIRSIGTSTKVVILTDDNFANLFMEGQAANAQ